jgi:ACR3 family arsenite efflux pump ArsB
VNMNTLGRGSNPHQLGLLLGLLLTVVAAAPAAGIAYVGLARIGEPVLTAAMLAGWCALACVLAYVLMKPVQKLLLRRRENLGLVAMGR